MEKYQTIAYMLGCYMVIADKEINALEVEVLENYLHSEPTNELDEQQKLIFSDNDERKDLSTLFYELRLLNINAFQKQEILQLLADIAFGDDYLATSERELLVQVANVLNHDVSTIIKDCENRSKERLESQRLKGLRRLAGKTKNYLDKHFSIPNNNRVIERLFGDLGYSSSIEDITDNALIDLERVSRITDGINGSLSSAVNELNNLKFTNRNQAKEVAEVSQIVTDIKSDFIKLLNVSLKENREILDKKRRNIRYFTLAFMGRTKAGKSTLHKVITQQAKDDIGDGKIRTTRYNRSWYWNKLRIVDTPGIGAPGGETDTEIAKSIIDDADIICYIVTNDSQQETEFNFFETIKDRNKPLYVLLNYKSNLTQSIRLKRFLANPSDWKDCTGPQSLKGHFDRIHERLDGKYNMEAVEIIPVHLLAALMGFSNDYPEDVSQKLQEGSNIDAFTRSVKEAVQNSGGLKKSLSVVDGTGYQIHQITLSLGNDLKELRRGHDLLVKKSNSFNSFIQEEKKKLFSDISKIFNNGKTELKNRVATFAEENYNRKDAGKRWEEDKVVKSIFSRINSSLTQHLEDFNDRVKTEIKEIGQDIAFSTEYSASSNVSGSAITNTRLGVGILGSLITGSAPFVITNIWNPAGWVVALATGVIGIICGFAASFFSSKSEKVNKAIAEMKEQLNSSIGQAINESQQEAMRAIGQSIGDISSTISKLFSTYIEGTGNILSRIEYLNDQGIEGESAINSLVGFRILEFAGQKVIKDSKINHLDNRSLSDQFPVKRDWETQSIRYLYKVKLSSSEIEKINKAAQLKVITK